MFPQALIILLAIAALVGIAMTLVGIVALLRNRRSSKSLTAKSSNTSGSSETAVAASMPTANPTSFAEPSPATAASVTLEGKGTFAAEPGVLLNTLWEHLPNAECQEGECGGCKMRLLEGKVHWIREPVVEVDRRTHFLACSCEATGSIQCATL